MTKRPLNATFFDDDLDIGPKVQKIQKVRLSDEFRPKKKVGSKHIDKRVYLEG